MKADQLSKTAAFVAIKFYGLTRDERFRSLFHPSVITFYDQLVQSLPAPLSYYHYWLQYSWVRRQYIRMEELLLPGDLLHIIARKFYIQQITQQLIDDEYEQIIVLGAGFDHLGYHFAQKGFSCFEMDAPQMVVLKKQFLQERYPSRIHPDIIATHLSADKPVSKFINHPKIDEHKKTIIVAEGFFDYLTPNIVNQTLKRVNNYFSHSTALVSTHFALDELTTFHREVFKTSVRLVGEQLRFNTSIKTFKQILNDQGYSISQLYEAHEIRENVASHVKTKLSMLKGFYIFSAKT